MVCFPDSAYLKLFLKEILFEHLAIKTLARIFEITLDFFVLTKLDLKAVFKYEWIACCSVFLAFI